MNTTKCNTVSLNAIGLGKTPLNRCSVGKKGNPTPGGLFLIDADGYQLKDGEGFMLTVKS